MGLNGHGQTRISGARFKLKHRRNLDHLSNSDSIIWEPGPNGKFSIVSALQSKSYLCARGFRKELSCVLCKGNVENVEHLFSFRVHSPTEFGLCTMLDKCRVDRNVLRCCDTVEWMSHNLKSGRTSRSTMEEFLRARAGGWCKCIQTS